MNPPADLSSESPAEDSFPSHRLFVPNLVLMIVLGVLVSAWLLRYTELFAEFDEISS
jgi:hypothetical protein